MNFNDIEQHNEKLRPYQVEMKQRVFDAWQLGLKSIMMQMPTGTGKTMLFVSIIKDIWDYYFEKKRELKRFIILVHRKELVEQVQRALYSKYQLAHGTIGGGYNEDRMFHIQVAMVHTLARDKRLKDWSDNKVDFIICDEAHHFLANDYVKIRKTFPNAYLLGVTATPYRLNNQPFTDFFDILLRSKSINDFIKDGWLSEYEYYSIEATSSLQTEIDNLRVLNTGDYSENAMSKALDNKRIRAGVVKTWLKYAKGKKTIVYTVNQEHNKHLCKEFEEQGFRSVAIDSQTPKEERECYVEKFRQGEITIICNVNIFSEGFDCPDVECIQLTRPTKSLSMYLQQVGRGFRIAKNKEKTIFLDNVGLYNRFGLPSANRKWQMHFEGEEDWDKTENDYPENVCRVRTIEIEKEADDEMYKIYSNVDLEKDTMTLRVLSEQLGVEINKILDFFRVEIEDINPNTILTEQQYDELLKYIENMENKTDTNGFISIFDIPNIEAQGKMNFYCKIKNYKTNEWEIVFYKRFVDCYVDVINRTYCGNLFKNTSNEFIIAKTKKYLLIDRVNKIDSKLLSNGEEIEVGINNIAKMGRLKYILQCTGEDMFFNFSMRENVNNTQPIVVEDKEVEDNIIKMNDMMYNIDKMDEKEIIELMFILCDKVSIELFDKQRAENRLKELENEKEMKEMKEIKEKIDATGLDISQIQKYLALVENENKKL